MQERMKKGRVLTCSSSNETPGMGLTVIMSTRRYSKKFIYVE
jgi:hypothetical protein